MTPTWASAAEHLARAVTRRARLGILLRHLAAGALGGAGATLLVRALSPTTDARLLVPASVLLGGLLGLSRARRVPATDLGSAAWALDRLGSAHERGLSAALNGPEPLEGPPRIRLAPPAGVAFLLGSALVATTVALGALPEASLAPGIDASPAASAPAATEGTGAGSAGQEVDDAQSEQRVAEAQRVRAALGLTRSAAQDVSAVAEQLRDPQVLAALRAAADASSPLAQVAEQASPSAEALAHGLAQAARVADALSAARRAQLEASLEAGSVSVPPSRRTVVARYASLARRSGGR